MDRKGLWSKTTRELKPEKLRLEQLEAQVIKEKEENGKLKAAVHVLQYAAKRAEISKATADKRLSTQTTLYENLLRDFTLEIKKANEAKEAFARERRHLKDLVKWETKSKNIYIKKTSELKKKVSHLIQEVENLRNQSEKATGNSEESSSKKRKVTPS